MSSCQKSKIFRVSEFYNFLYLYVIFFGVLTTKQKHCTRESVSFCFSSRPTFFSQVALLLSLGRDYYISRFEKDQNPSLAHKKLIWLHIYVASCFLFHSLDNFPLAHIIVYLKLNLLILISHWNTTTKDKLEFSLLIFLQSTVLFLKKYCSFFRESIILKCITTIYEIY